MEVATSLLGSAKEWYAEHAIGHYVLTIIGVAWIAHIVKQLVSSSALYSGFLT